MKFRAARSGGLGLHRRTAAALVGAVVLATGCASAPTSMGSTSASASAVRAVPSGTVTLASLGWKNGPADRVVLPVGTVIDRRIDQGNVITATGAPSGSAAVLLTLTETLPAYGWTITASGGGSLVFSDARYDGAFTSDASVWALTIRVKA